MNYLHETIAVFECKECENRCFGHHLKRNGYGDTWCPVCETHDPKYLHDIFATFWSVAVYSVDSQYGGPEEGGWWYEVLSLVKLNHVRVFESFDEAKSYQDLLFDKLGESRYLRVIGFTERLPASTLPEVRPRYC